MRYKTAAWIAAALLLATVIVGFAPVRAEGVNCGSAFHGTDDAAVADLGSTLSGSLGPATNTQGACDSLRSIIRIPALLLLTGAVISGITSASLYASATAPAARARARKTRPTW